MGVRDVFTTETAGLAEASGTEVIRLHDGDRLDLRICPVRKSVGEAELRMLAYNGSIPGPTLQADQGSEITVHVRNDGDVDTTVHWHGLRLENRYDGVPHETQQPIPIGGTFTYQVQFPRRRWLLVPPCRPARPDRAVEPHLLREVLAQVRVGGDAAARRPPRPVDRSGQSRRPHAGREQPV